MDADFELKQERRARAVKAIHNILTMEEPDRYLETSPVFARMLSQDEIALLAWSLLNALPWETAKDVIHSMVAPVAVVSVDQDHLFNADLWSRDASVPELKAYLLNAFRKLPPKERASFVNYAKGRV